MKLRNTAVLAAITLSLLGGAGVAAAQETETGPETQICTDATAAVATATTERDAAKVPSDLEQKTKAAQDAVDTGVKAMADIQADIDKNQKLLDGLGATPPPSTKEYFTKAVADGKVKLAEAKTAQAGLVAARDAAAKNLSDAQAKLATEEQELATAETARDTACAEPTDPGTENPGDENQGDDDQGNNDSGNDNGNDDNGSDNGTDNGGTGNGNVDNGGSDNAGTDNGLDPGPITTSNGESVYVPEGGVATGGGPA